MQKVRRSSMSKYSSSVRTMLTCQHGNGRAERDYARFSARAAMDIEALDLAIRWLQAEADMTLGLPPPEVLAEIVRKELSDVG